VPNVNEVNAERIRYGADCMILPHRVTKRATSNEQTVLALTGGADVANLGRIWPRVAARTLPPNIRITWVKGPLAEAPLVDRSLEDRIRLVSGSENLSTEISQASFGLVVHGISAYELLSAGVPSVVFSPYGAKDDGSMAFLENSRLARISHSSHDAVNQLLYLVNNPKEAERMAEKARNFLGVPGELTLASELLEILKLAA
jgi:spore coat polysaccharide biosynthesis predicted glycosyltransferase SpsG